jgi:hypothetical protein
LIEPQRLHAVRIEISARSPDEFAVWRTAARNNVDYRRRRDERWQDLSMVVWVGRDGRARGVVSLGTLSECEFMARFGDRWPTRLDAIHPECLRLEIWAAMRPGVVADVQPSGARYQHVRWAIWPSKGRQQSGPSQTGNAALIAPMPTLL